MNYTLILYKSDGCNTCRGCVMEQWGSEFDLDADITEEEAVNKIAEAFARPSEGGSYEAHLIGVIEEHRDKYDNGLLTPTEKVIYRFSQYYGSAWRQEEGSYQTLSYHCDSNESHVQAEGARIDKLIREKVTSILDARAQLEKKRKEEEDANKIKQQEIFERNQLNALKQKYEGNK